MRAYKQREFEDLEPYIQTARQIVEQTIVDKKIRDSGTCTIGEGIAIDLIPPRCRNPKRVLILDAPFQGSTASHEALKPALEYLQSKGIECTYEWGRMD